MQTQTGNKPSTKQIEYVKSLAGLRFDGDAMKLIADTVGKSRMAPGRLTSADASRTIERLKR